MKRGCGNMEFIHTNHSKFSSGHYCPAIIHDGIVYISGQLPINYDLKEKFPKGSLKDQVKQALSNLEAVLIQCGSSRKSVLKTTVYVSDIDGWEEVNQTYAEFFGEHKPARTIVPAAGLHFNSLIEIDAVAAVESEENKG